MQLLYGSVCIITMLQSGGTALSATPFLWEIEVGEP